MGFLKSLLNYPAPTRVPGWWYDDAQRRIEALEGSLAASQEEVRRLEAVIRDMETREIKMRAELDNWQTWCDQMLRKYPGRKW